MFAILISAINTAFGFIFRTVAIKFVLFVAIYLVVSEFIPFVSSKLPDSIQISSLFNSLPDGVLFFVNVLALGDCLPILASAHFTRFFIRRLPVIG